MSEPAPPDATPTWSSLDDVYATLGSIGRAVRAAVEGSRLDAEAQLDAARVEAYTRLSRLYGAGAVPTPEQGTTGYDVIRWAVARLAAANVLDILRASLADVSELPERLRRTAWATLDSGVPGIPPGGNPETGSTPAPFSSSGGVSLFPDPGRYAYGYGRRDGATNTPGWLP